MGDRNAIPSGALAPHELRNAMRSALKSTLAQMDSDEFLDALEAATAEERRAAAIARGEVFRAWRRLNNQQLDEIREQLETNEAELRQATGELAKATAGVAQVAALVDTANQFLNLAARVITLV
jgi:hypothetical protein